MRKMSNRLLVLVIAGTVFVAGLGTSAVLATYGGGDYVEHEASSSMTNEECIGCHGQMALERSLDPYTFTAHKRHLYSAFLRFQMIDYGCATCHESVDQWEDCGAGLRQQVDPGFCVSCHGTFAGTAHGADLASTQPRGCTVCHSAGGSATDPVVAHASVDYVNKYYTRSRTYCTKCHGGLAFYDVEETNN